MYEILFLSVVPFLLNGFSNVQYMMRLWFLLAAEKQELCIMSTTETSAQCSSH